MKYIKNFTLYEAGEWSSDIDWQYVKDNPDDTSQEAALIRSLEDSLNYIKNELDNPEIFIIKDIRGFDMYQGPYAMVKIFDRTYKVWITDADDLWIDDFPIDNCSDEGKKPGYEGMIYDIADMLNDIINSGGDINLYKDTKKYNL